MATQSEPHLTTQIFGQNPTNILACCANPWSRKFLRKSKSEKKTDLPKICEALVNLWIYMVQFALTLSITP